MYEEITNEIRNLKKYQVNDQDKLEKLLKMIRCSSYDVHNNIIRMDFFRKVEFIKQYRQSVMDSKNVNFFKSVRQHFQFLKIMTMVVVYEKIPKFFMIVEPCNL